MKEVFRFPQGFKLDEDNGRSYLPKIGWERYRKSRLVTAATPMNVTLKLKGGKWLVAIQTENQIPDPIPKATRLVGRMNMQRTGHARLACDTSEVVKPLSARTHREAPGGSCAVGLIGITML